MRRKADTWCLLRGREVDVRIGAEPFYHAAEADEEEDGLGCRAAEVPGRGSRMRSAGMMRPRLIYLSLSPYSPGTSSCGTSCV
jgi:hypothetical protein